MKTWTIPVAVAQQFVANDYVSACTYEILCDLELPEGAKCLQIPAPFDYNQDGIIDDGQNLYYSPCGAKHSVATNTEFYDYTFTIGSTKFNNQGLFRLDEPIVSKFWVELDSNGNLHDAHFTAPENLENLMASNKS